MSWLLKKLESAIVSGRAMHAYLLSGADPALTDGAARSCAALMLFGTKDVELLPDDPDYMEYSGSVAIGDFRDTIRPEIYRETYGRAGRVVVFLSADQLSPMVQNAMLKVLEEPPENTRFILTGNEYGILPTIRSRCTVIRCAAPDISEIKSALLELGAGDSEAERFSRQSGGSVTRAKRLYESEDARKLRESALGALLAAMNAVPDLKWTKVKREKADFIEANELMLLACHDMLLIKCGLPAECFPDRAEELKKAASRFTLGGISCIVDELTENAERLASPAPAGAAFDRLFVRVAEISKKSK